MSTAAILYTMKIMNAMFAKWIWMRMKWHLFYPAIFPPVSLFPDGRGVPDCKKADVGKKRGAVLGGQHLFQLSYDDTDHFAVAVVNDFLQGVLKLLLAFLSHLSDLCLNPVVHNLFNGFSKNVGFPNAVLPVSGIFLHIIDQIPGLFFPFLQ